MWEAVLFPVYVLYDRKAMIEHIINSDMPNKEKIGKFVGMK